MLAAPHQTPGSSRDDRAAALDRIRAEIVADPDNAWATEQGWAPIYTAGPAARIVVISQAPGWRAQASGIPFDDDLSGRALRDWLGVTDAEFYDPAHFAILPMDFYYPGRGTSGDKPPRRGIAATWHPRILEQLTEVRLTLLVGGYAQRRYLGGRASLTDTVRAYRDHLPAVLPLVHPSPLTFGWRARNPWFEADVLPALKGAVRDALA